MAILFLYMTLAINILNGCISNTVHCDCLPGKTKVKQYKLQKDYQVVPTSRSISNIKVNGRCIATHLKKVTFLLYCNLCTNVKTKVRTYVLKFKL